MVSTNKNSFDVKDVKLAETGKQRIEWAEREMPVLRLIKERFAYEKPLKGIRVSGCLHITTETANLGLTCRQGSGHGIMSLKSLSKLDTCAALVEYAFPLIKSRQEE
jgi:adenosylhomocysteinase